MSKVSFRARALDANKPLLLYSHEEVPDAGNVAVINRSVPQLPTGMEKEEEAECHLQEALYAFQQYKSTCSVRIPVPEIISVESKFKSIYIEGFRPPKNYIRSQAFAFSDDEAPEYDVDDEDTEWLRQNNLGIDTETFEQMLDTLERGSGHKVVELSEAKALLKQDDDLTIAIYDYWLNKRLKKEHALIPTVKIEKRDGTSDRDPYVAFRRRTEKMQTRKNRKNDEHSYEKMLILNRDMIKAVDLLDLVAKREMLKQEQLKTNLELYERRYEMHDFANSHLSEALMAVRRSTSSLPPLTSLLGTSFDSVLSNSGRIDHKLHNEIERQHKQAMRRQRKLARVRQRSFQNRVSPYHAFSSDGEERFESSNEKRNSSIGIPAAPTFSDAGPQLPEEAFPFRRMRGVMYAAPRGPLLNYRRLSNIPPAVLAVPSSYDRFQLSCLNSVIHSRRSKLTAYMRQRISRGGRRVFDVAHVSPEIDKYLSWRDTVMGGESDSEEHACCYCHDTSMCKNDGLHLPVFTQCSCSTAKLNNDINIEPSAVCETDVRSLTLPPQPPSLPPPLPPAVPPLVEHVSTSLSSMDNCYYPVIAESVPSLLTVCASVASAPSASVGSVNPPAAVASVNPPAACSAITDSALPVPNLPHKVHNGINMNSAARLPPASASTMVAKAREQLQLHQVPQQLGCNASSNVTCLGLSTEPAANIKQLNYPLSTGNLLHGLGVVGADSSGSGFVGQPRILKIASAGSNCNSILLNTHSSGSMPPISLNRRKRKSESEFVVVTSDSEMDIS